jgi:hypothetical protein
VEEETIGYGELAAVRVMISSMAAQLMIFLAAAIVTMNCMAAQLMISSMADRRMMLLMKVLT